MANARVSAKPLGLDPATAGVLGPVAEDPLEVDTLRKQYRDGDDRMREHRIDHIFAQGVDTYLAASYDISCGDLASSRAGRRNCAWLQSPERYSDHRLVWALMGANLIPSQDLVEPPRT